MLRGCPAETNKRNAMFYIQKPASLVYVIT